MVPRRLSLWKGSLAWAAAAIAVASVSSAFAEDSLDIAIGKALFERNWVPAPSSTTADDGLGPFYDATSCASCHAQRIPPGGMDHGIAPGTVIRLGNAGGTGDPVYGEQLQTRAVSSLEPEGIPDIQWVAKGALRLPMIAAQRLNYGALAKGTTMALRRAPPLAGLGLLAQIPESEIVKRAASRDAARDGIAGRPSYVTVDGKQVLGRFGWKATEPDLAAQAAIAFSRDLGLSTSRHPDPSGDCTAAEGQCRAAPQGALSGEPEIADLMVKMIAGYVASLPAPSAQAGKGKAVFNQVGCAVCHATFRLPDGASIAAYSDLLLHDMGDGLNDGIKEGGAAPGEWRTAPLMGVATSLKTQSLLHDGRARSVAEAIEWHGGEAASVRARFRALSASEKEALVAFVGAL